MVHPNLVLLVLELSKSTDLKEAIKEWHIHSSYDANPVGTTENGAPLYADSCLCGKEGIKEIYVIENTVTRHMLSPIGSKCVQSFNSELMDGQLTEHQKELRKRREQSPEHLEKELKKFWAKIYDPATGEITYEVNGSYLTRNLIKYLRTRELLEGYWRPVTKPRTQRDRYSFEKVSAEEVQELILSKFNGAKLSQSQEHYLEYALNSLFVALSKLYKG